MELRTQIEQRLRQDQRIDASLIDVAVVNGKVTLRGCVNTPLASALAQEHSAVVHGVSEVDNRLDVGFPSKIAMPNDQAIRARIQAVLSLNPDIMPADLILVVSEGVAFIDGFVKTLKDKQLIGNLVVREQGVVAVRNYLLVSPSRDRTDTDIDGDIRKALADIGTLDDTRVRVQVRKGIVTFRGEVPGKSAHRILTDTASSVPGVTEVRNLASVRGESL